MNAIELEDFLNYKASTYENIRFLEDDPIQIPHTFKNKKMLKFQLFLWPPSPGEIGKALLKVVNA